MPFGIGPRICVGMRLALLEKKMAIVHILQNYKISRSEKTEVGIMLVMKQKKYITGSEDVD